MTQKAARGVILHAEGWQLGLLAVALAACAAWLALPRPVAPSLLPLPAPDARAFARDRARDEDRARRAESARPPFEVRAVGELVRRYGAASAAGDARRAEGARTDAMLAAQKALRTHGAEALAGLRAVQTALFLDAIARFRGSGHADRELGELAGDFLEKCRTEGWLDREGRLVAGDAELRVLYRLRWTELVGLRADPILAPTREDYRVYYRFLLEHPEGARADERERRRLAYVAALARHDVAFPADYARGVLLARLGQTALAAQAWRNHLEAHPDGSWSARAQNHLLWALAASSNSE